MAFQKPLNLNNLTFTDITIHGGEIRADIIRAPIVRATDSLLIQWDENHYYEPPVDVEAISMDPQLLSVLLEKSGVNYIGQIDYNSFICFAGLSRSLRLVLRDDKAVLESTDAITINDTIIVNPNHTATLNGVNIATTADLPNLTPYAPKASPVFTGTPKIGALNVATVADIPYSRIRETAISGSVTVAFAAVTNGNVAATINLNFASAGFTSPPFVGATLRGASAGIRAFTIVVTAKSTTTATITVNYVGAGTSTAFGSVPVDFFAIGPA